MHPIYGRHYSLIAAIEKLTVDNQLQALPASAGLQQALLETVRIKIFSIHENSKTLKG